MLAVRTQASTSSAGVSHECDSAGAGGDSATCASGSSSCSAPLTLALPNPTGAVGSFDAAAVDVSCLQAFMSDPSVLATAERVADSFLAGTPGSLNNAQEMMAALFSGGGLGSGGFSSRSGNSGGGTGNVVATDPNLQAGGASSAGASTSASSDSSGGGGTAPASTAAPTSGRPSGKERAEF
jgi:hypothetical protein